MPVDQFLAEQEGVDAERLGHLAARYEQWKRERSYVDFEDLLGLGAERKLPVDVLLCDEVQDQSPLMWRTLDAWAREPQLTVFAGDPYQSLYSFVGANPDLFWLHRAAGISSDEAIAFVQRQYPTREIYSVPQGMSLPSGEGYTWYLGALLIVRKPAPDSSWLGQPHCYPPLAGSSETLASPTASCEATDR